MQTDLDELNGLERAGGDESRSAARAGAPRDHLALGVPDDAKLRRSPKTKVLHRVDVRGLAARLGALGRGVAPVVPGLDSSRSVARVDHEGEIVVIEAAVRERDRLAQRSRGAEGGEDEEGEHRERKVKVAGRGQEEDPNSTRNSLQCCGM